MHARDCLLLFLLLNFVMSVLFDSGSECEVSERVTDDLGSLCDWFKYGCSSSAFARYTNMYVLRRRRRQWSAERTHVVSINLFEHIHQKAQMKLAAMTHLRMQCDARIHKPIVSKVRHTPYSALTRWHTSQSQNQMGNFSLFRIQFIAVFFLCRRRRCSIWCPFWKWQRQHKTKNAVIHNEIKTQQYGQNIIGYPRPYAE